MGELLAEKKQQVASKKAINDVLGSDRLIAAIESGYRTDRVAEFKVKKSFSPSTLTWGSGACPRYWNLAFSGQMYIGDEDTDPKSIASMANGTASHDRLQKAMKVAGILVESETRVVQTSPPIFGFCDAIIEWEGKKIPVEIKTMREEAFVYRKSTGEAADYHKAQLLIYMRELGFDTGVLIYESKNSHELLAIPLTMDETNKQWLDELYDWMRLVRKTWVDGKTVKKPYRNNSKVCKTCPLQGPCTKLGASPNDVEIAPLRMLGE